MRGQDLPISPVYTIRKDEGKGLFLIDTWGYINVWFMKQIMLTHFKKS